MRRHEACVSLSMCYCLHRRDKLKRETKMKEELAEKRRLEKNREAMERNASLPCRIGYYNNWQGFSPCDVSRDVIRAISLDGIWVSTAHRQMNDVHYPKKIVRCQYFYILPLANIESSEVRGTNCLLLRFN